MNQNLQVYIAISDQVDEGKRVVQVNQEFSHHIAEDELQELLEQGQTSDWGYHQEVGKALGLALWALLDGTTSKLTQALAQTYQSNQSLQLYVDLPPDLDDLSLELLYQHGFLLLRDDVHVIRLANAERGSHAQHTSPARPLRLLFMAASPEESQSVELDFEKEEEQIYAQTERLPVELHVEDSGSLTELSEKLVELGEVDVLHLSGHATIDPHLGPVFLLENDLGQADWVSPQQLWNAIRDYPPRVLFLSGCNTSQARSTQSFARQMVQLGCRWALGWGLKVSDQGATQMTQTLYRYLAEGKSLDFALARARQEVKDNYHPWALLRLVANATPLTPLVAINQLPRRPKPKPRQIMYRTLEKTNVQVLKQGFVGRRRHLQRGMQVLMQYSPEHYGLLITGAAGVGKSCLAGKLLDRCAASHQALVFSGQLSRGKVLQAFRAFFEQHGHLIALAILDTSELDYAAKVEQCFRTIFSEIPLLIYWDNFEDNLERSLANTHQLTSEAAAVVAPFLKALPWADGSTQLLISSRYPFKYEMGGENKVAALQELPLMAMRKAELSKKLANLPHMSQSEHLALYIDIGRGNPRLLEWLEEVAQREAELDIANLQAKLQAKSEEYINLYLAELLANTEGEEFLSFLRKASVYRQPAPASAYAPLLETGQNWLTTAQGLTLMECDAACTPARYWLNPVLQNGFWNDLDADTQRELHLMALDYYEQVIGKETMMLESTISLEELTEAYQHALNAGEYLRACMPLVGLSHHLTTSFLYADSIDTIQQVLLHLSDGDILQALGDKNYFLITCFNNLGNNLRSLGRYEEALGCLIQSLSRLEEYFPENEDLIASGLHNLGASYAALGYYVDAQKHLQKSCDLREKIFGENSNEFAEVCITLGNVYAKTLNFEKSVSLLKKALIINEKKLGKSHLNTLSNYGSLGMVFGMLGQTKEGVKYLQKAIVNCKAIFGEENPHLTTYYNNLSLVYSYDKKFEQALVFQEKALALQKALLPKLHPSISISYTNLGGIYSGLGDKMKAIESLEIALSLRERLSDLPNADLAINYYNLAGLYFEKREYNNSLRYIEKAISEAIATLTIKHQLTQKMLNLCVELLEIVGKSPQEIRLFFQEKGISSRKM